ncbi:MAG: hypothetical protein BGP01_08310 [Paludibacter sp. 47-17]|jgi:hypothetical protein|nr:MAG: hypothetical protein ABS72_01960 [Paludibacter sp. SCN 50-10]OJX83271.1 MAG: hypothetical protein BGP01_08310 [Paludibacter sp. 47-17]
MKYGIFFFSLICLFACEKEYFPEPNAYRDEALFGTWKRLGENNEIYETAVEVYTEQGYCGGTIGFNNAQSNYKTAFQNIDGIWYVEKANSTNGYQFNRIHSQSYLRSKFFWKDTQEYYIQNDTLFLRKLDDTCTDTLVKYKYQLKYDKTKFVGLDSIE